jgi:ELWxxDGT repeat protein
MLRSLTRLAAPVLALLLLSAAAQGQTASLVRDIKSEGFGEGSAPEAFYATPGRLFFFGRGIDGWGVWVSDGTSAGTQFLVDLCPQNECYPAHGYGFVGHVGNTVLWVSLGPGDFERRLWRSDGTRAGTYPLAGPGTAISNPHFDVNDPDERTHVLFQGAFYFQGCQETSCGTWRVAGNAAEAVQTGDLGLFPTVVGDRLFFLELDANRFKLRVTSDPSAGSTPLGQFSQPERLTAAGNKLFFVAHTHPEEQELWVSDGTAAGTRPATAFVPSEPLFGDSLHPAGNRVYFVADDGEHGAEIWVSDGTAQGTRRVTEFDYDSPVSGRSGRMEEVNGKLVFIATDGIHPAWLWTTTGTPGATTPLPACNSCKLLDEPTLVRAGGRVVFAANDPEYGTELWGSDGTAVGTRLMADICLGSCFSINDSRQLLPWLGGALVMAARNDTHGHEIWFSDGTPAGTRRLTELAAPDALDGDHFTPPASFAGKVWFAAGNSFGDIADTGLWVTDGEPSTTRLVAHLGQSEPSSQPDHLTPAGGRLYFSAHDSIGHGLWSTLGSPESTVLVTTANPDPFAPSRIVGVDEAGGLVYFWEEDASSRKLWRTDGTAAGTFALREDDDLPIQGTAFQGRLYFNLRDQLWSSDGTVQGTALIFTNPGEGSLFTPAVAGGAIYFATTDDDVWRSNGTPGGTLKLADVPGVSHYQRADFVSSGPLVFFTAGGQLGKTDGTPAGTQMVAQPGELRNLTAFQGAAFYFGYYQGGDALWRSDGTAAGTAVVRAFVGDVPRGLTVFAGRLFFAAGDAEHGFELWTSDGTAAGTAIERDLFPGPRSSNPRELTVAGNRLFFAAGDGPHGTELWTSDGTAAGTRLVQDLNPYADSSMPGQLTAAGDRLYFTADDGLYGRELWTLPLAAGPACQPTATRLCLNGGRFLVEAAWKDFQGNRGHGQAVALTPDTGYFWFFSPSNVEAVLKVLDGRGLNDHFWTFYGALSSVEYHLTVTDTQTGAVRRYFNPPGQLASVGDTTSFGPLGAFSVAQPAPSVLAEEKTAAAGPCQPTEERLCLNNQRFAVEVAWKDFQGNTGKGKAFNLTADTGWFWFFDAANVEVVLKVLDGTPLNGKHWVFYGALSSVEYTITVTDTQTGAQKIYKNPSGKLASVADTGAF